MDAFFRSKEVLWCVCVSCHCDMNCFGGNGTDKSGSGFGKDFKPHGLGPIESIYKGSIFESKLVAILSIKVGENGRVLQLGESACCVHCSDGFFFFFQKNPKTK